MLAHLCMPQMLMIWHAAQDINHTFAQADLLVCTHQSCFWFPLGQTDNLQCAPCVSETLRRCTMGLDALERLTAQPVPGGWWPFRLHT